MALNTTQQFFEHIKRSKHPLICIPSNGGPDAFASAIGLARVFEKLDTSATLVSATPETPENVCFLNGHERIDFSLECVQQYVIELDAKETDVDELSYEMRDGKLCVFVSPKTGEWNETNVQLTSRGYRHDLIICLGSPDLDACDRLFREHPDFFFQTTIVNIDHAPENEHFGEVNLVDLTASAIGEICHDVIEACEPELFDEEVATAFLTGMIAKTKSFKERNITPKTLDTASKLIAHGADRERIVRHLYRRRSVSTLRLWGRVLARLQSDTSTRMVWSLLSQQDFMHAGSKEKELPDVIDELIASSPDARVVLLLYENDKKYICGVLRTQRPLNARKLVAHLEPSGAQTHARFVIKDQSIVDAAKRIVPELRDAIRKQLDLGVE